MKYILLLSFVSSAALAKKADEVSVFNKEKHCNEVANAALHNSSTWEASVYIDKSGKIKKGVRYSDAPEAKVSRKGNNTLVNYPESVWKTVGDRTFLTPVMQEAYVERDKDFRILKITKKYNQESQEKSSLYPTTTQTEITFSHGDEGCVVEQSVVDTVFNGKREKIVTYDKKLCDQVLPHLGDINTETIGKCVNAFEKINGAQKSRNAELKETGKELAFSGNQAWAVDKNLVHLISGCAFNAGIPGIRDNYHLNFGLSNFKYAPLKEAGGQKSQ